MKKLSEKPFSKVISLEAFNESESGIALCYMYSSLQESEDSYKHELKVEAEPR